jgi:GNAT superfamily N-acetyltransferase
MATAAPSAKTSTTAPLHSQSPVKTRTRLLANIREGTGRVIAAAASIMLRPMTAADRDLDGALLLSQAVRWPYRRDDWSVALALGQGVLVEADGRIMASALWWPYGDGFATCGTIIVSPDMQGRGLGRILMENLLTANSGRCILLNSTQEGHRLYESFGFRNSGSVHQHQAQTPMEAAQTPLSGNDSRVRAARPDDMPAILCIDENAFGAERTKLIAEFDRIGIAAVIERKGAVQGFAMCRPFGLGQAIGPIIARSAGDAQSLIRYFLRAKAGEFLRVDITGDSGLGDWLTAQGLPEVGNVTTMIRGMRPPVTGPERIHGLASQSFG